MVHHKTLESFHRQFPGVPDKLIEQAVAWADKKPGRYWSDHVGKHHIVKIMQEHKLCWKDAVDWSKAHAEGYSASARTATDTPFDPADVQIKEDGAKSLLPGSKDSVETIRRYLGCSQADAFMYFGMQSASGQSLEEFLTSTAYDLLCSAFPGKAINHRDMPGVLGLPVCQYIEQYAPKEQRFIVEVIVTSTRQFTTDEIIGAVNEILSSSRIALRVE